MPGLLCHAHSRQTYSGCPQWSDVLALSGDTADNVPGVAGVGPKTALSLLQRYGDLEGVLGSAGEARPKHALPRRRMLLLQHTSMPGRAHLLCKVLQALLFESVEGWEREQSLPCSVCNLHGDIAAHFNIWRKHWGTWT